MLAIMGFPLEPKDASLWVVMTLGRVQSWAVSAGVVQVLLLGFYVEVEPFL